MTTPFRHRNPGPFRRAADAGADVPADLTVGQVAALVGVSVRTLHHWDEIGLVRPSGRTRADYRVYSGSDISRIHRVLVYRELGLHLAEVARLLDDPEVDEVAHLRRQRALLSGRISHLREMVSAVDRMLEAKQMGTPLTPEQQSEIFGTDWRPEWAQEAEERWGNSPQWAQSQQRMAAMSREEREQARAAGETLNADLGAAKRAGVQAGSAEANALAERHRAMISQSYDCTHSMQVCLTRMYVEDPRFTAFYEKIEPGLAVWLREVIGANARSHGVDPETATWE
ncbi:MerR family transcriptional regulator [Micromonospora sp. NPDC003197]